MGVNLRKLIFLFYTTLGIGGITTVIITPLLGDQPLFAQGFANALMGSLYNLLLGFLFSILSQVGFFAYLMLHRFGLGFFRKPALWNGVQLILIGIVFFDVGDLRYRRFAESGDAYLSFFIMPTLFLLCALIVAGWKAWETKASAFVPAVFFMFVVTVLELIYALTTNNMEWLRIMYSVIFLCNTWQLMQLHRLTDEG